MKIYENGEVREVDCDVYEPFPEPVEEEEDEGSREKHAL